MSKYAKGANYEWKVKKDYEKLGYRVTRSAGSHGEFDLIAINLNEVVLIQCKRVCSVGSNIRKEIKNMKKIKVPKGCRKEFRIKVDYKPETVIHC